MEWLKRNAKTVISALIILILLEAVGAWYLIDQFRENYLSGEEALAVALEDAGLDRNDAQNADIRLKTEKGSAWYEIGFKAADTAYEYHIDAETGDILLVRAQ